MLYLPSLHLHMTIIIMLLESQGLQKLCERFGFQNMRRINSSILINCCRSLGDIGFEGDAFMKASLEFEKLMLFRFHAGYFSFYGLNTV